MKNLLYAALILPLLAFGGGSAFAGDDCVKPDDIVTQIHQKNPEVELKQVVTSDAVVVKDLLQIITNTFGDPPIDKNLITKIVVYKPNDEEKYNTYVAFFGADDCKLTGIMIPSAVFNEIVRQASGNGS